MSETDRFKPVNYTGKDRRLCEMNVVVFGLKMIEDFSSLLANVNCGLESSCSLLSISGL